ncbi:MAG: hypothetical protein ACPGSD_14785 [Flavobacteriales bacterium]
MQVHSTTKIKHSSPSIGQNKYVETKRINVLYSFEILLGGMLNFLLVINSAFLLVIDDLISSKTESFISIKTVLFTKTRHFLSINSLKRLNEKENWILGQMKYDSVFLLAHQKHRQIGIPLQNIKDIKRGTNKI